MTVSWFFIKLIIISGERGLCHQNAMNSIEYFPLPHHDHAIYNFTWDFSGADKIFNELFCMHCYKSLHLDKNQLMEWNIVRIKL